MGSQSVLYLFGRIKYLNQNFNSRKQQQKPSRETDSLVGRQVGREAESFRDGGLLLHPPDLRQKSGSFKQTPCRFLSPTSRSPVNGLTQQGWIRTWNTTVLGQLAILSFFKLTTPKLREEDPSKLKTNKQTMHPKKILGSSAFQAPHPCLLHGECFSLCACWMCMSPHPNKCLSSAANSACSCLWCLQFISCSLSCLRPFPCPLIL